MVIISIFTRTNALKTKQKPLFWDFKFRTIKRKAGGWVVGAHNLKKIEEWEN